MKPTADPVSRQPGELVHFPLSDDHPRLDRLFQSVIASARGGDPTTIRAEWQRFERELSAHMDEEERGILPAFAKWHDDQARSICDEHARIRSGLLELGVDLDLHCLRADRVEAFIELLRMHAAGEEAVLYPWARHSDVGGPS